MPFTVVQAAPTVSAASLTTASVTLGTATGSQGTSTLVAVITTNGNTANPAVTGLTLGGAAGNWQAAISDPGTTEFGAAIWYDPGCASGQTAVTVTCAGGSGTNPLIDIAMYEVLGGLVFDKGSFSDQAATGTTFTSGTTGTTAQAAEIFFGACMATNAAGATVTGAGTWITQPGSAGNNPQVAGYQAVSAAGTATFSGTVPSGGYSAVVATFLAAVRNATSSPAAAAVDSASGVVSGAVHGAAVAAQDTSAPAVSDG